MGNSNSMFRPGQKVIPGDYQLVGKVNTIRWGELFEMRNTKTTQMVYMQEKHAVDLDTYNKIVEDCTYYISLAHKNLATIYGFAGGDTPDLFTNTYKVCVFFEHENQSLQHLIRQRKNSFSPSSSQIQGGGFDESELLRFLTQLVDVFCFLQRNGINQGDITPDVCFITGEGVVKIVNKKLIYNNLTAFEAAQQGNYGVFLTKGELEALKNDEARPVENRYKADVFRLGLTLLECATLRRSSSIYDWNNCIMNIEEFTKRLIEVSQKYSPAFYNPLREMLRIDEHKRPDFIMLNRFLQEESVQKLTAPLRKTSKEEENYLKKSIFGMGPKLASNVAQPRIDSHSKSLQNSGEKGQNKIFDRKPAAKTMVGRVRKEEDVDDTGDGEDTTVNRIPNIEPRNSFDASKSMMNRSFDSPFKGFKSSAQKDISVDYGKRINVLDASILQPTTPQKFSQGGSANKSFSLRDFLTKNTGQQGQQGLQSPFRDSLIPANLGGTKVFNKGNPPTKNNNNNNNNNNSNNNIPSKPMFYGSNNASAPSTQRDEIFNNVNAVGSGHNNNINEYQYQNPFAAQPTRFITPAFQDPFQHSYSYRGGAASQVHLKSSMISDYRNQDPSPISVLNQSNSSSNLGFTHKVDLLYQQPTRSGHHSRHGSVSTPGGSLHQLNNDYRNSITPNMFNPVNPYQERYDFNRSREDGYVLNGTMVKSKGYEYGANKKQQDITHEWTNKNNSVMLKNQDQNKDVNEKDLVEKILRRVLNSAGISPPKKASEMGYSPETIILTNTNPTLAIKPVKIKYNENVVNPTTPFEIPQKYHMGSFGNSYGANVNSKVARNEEVNKTSSYVSPRSLQGYLKLNETTPYSHSNNQYQSKGSTENQWKSKPEIQGSMNEITKQQPKREEYGGYRGRSQERIEYSPPKKDNMLGSVNSSRTQSRIEDVGEVKVEDRFEMAMQRSKRSVGVMKDLVLKMSSSRNGSVEPDSRERTSHFGRGSAVASRR